MSWTAGRRRCLLRHYVAFARKKETRLLDARVCATTQLRVYTCSLCRPLPALDLPWGLFGSFLIVGALPHPVSDWRPRPTNHSLSRASASAGDVCLPLPASTAMLIHPGGRYPKSERFQDGTVVITSFILGACSFESARFRRRSRSARPFSKKSPGNVCRCVWLRFISTGREAPMSSSSRLDVAI